MPTKPSAFRPVGWQSPKQVEVQYEQRRGSAYSRGYDARWARASSIFRKANPLCLGCRAVDLITPTDLTDHVEPHRGDRSKFWNKAKWQPSCSWHHDTVKQRLEALFDQGRVGVDALWLNSPQAVRLTVELGGPEGRLVSPGRG